MGPNPVKPANPTDSQYYEGIKVRDNPLFLTHSTTTSPSQTPTKGQQAAGVQANARRRSFAGSPPSAPLNVVAGNGTQVENKAPPCPASPILAAQLNAPPRQPDIGKTQVGESMKMTGCL